MGSELIEQHLSSITDGSLDGLSPEFRDGLSIAARRYKARHFSNASEQVLAPECAMWQARPWSAPFCRHSGIPGSLPPPPQDLCLRRKSTQAPPHCCASLPWVRPTPDGRPHGRAWSSGLIPEHPGAASFLNEALTFFALHSRHGPQSLSAEIIFPPTPTTQFPGDETGNT